MPARRRLKDKETKDLVREFIQQYPTSSETLQEAKAVEEEAVDDDRVYFVDGRPLILRTNSGLLPSLRFDEFVNSLPRVVVDMGAVAHIANGAQIMRPGIKNFITAFSAGDLLLVVDEKFGKGIALGRAEVNSEEMRSAVKGKVIMNLHYVGDMLWNSFTVKAE